MQKESLQDYIDLYGKPLYEYEGMSNKMYDIPKYCYVFKINHPTKIMVVSGNCKDNLHANHGERTVILNLFYELLRITKGD